MTISRRRERIATWIARALELLHLLAPMALHEIQSPLVRLIASISIALARRVTPLARKNAGPLTGPRTVDDQMRAQREAWVPATMQRLDMSQRCADTLPTRP
jgi:hypothetical protein